MAKELLQGTKTRKAKQVETFAPANVSLEPAANLTGMARRMRNATAAYSLTGSALAAMGNFIFPTGIDFNGYGGWGGSWGGTVGTFMSIAPRDFDYSQVDPQASSIVMGCLNWISRTFKQARPGVYLPDAKGQFAIKPNHKAVKLLRRPNRFYSYSKLFSAIILDYYINGNAYVFKQKPGEDGTGTTNGLFFIPSTMIAPARLPLSNNLIDYYRYTVNGRQYAIPVDRIIHFRYELDITNPMLGRRPLFPVFSEIFGDEQGAKYTAALLKNLAIPGVVIVPEDDSVKIEDEDAEAMKEDFKRKFGGDGVGEPYIANFRAKVEVLGFNPEQMQLKTLRRIPEERVSSVLGVAAIVAGLGAGLDRSTYSNFEQAVAHSIENCLVPLWEDFADTLTGAFLPEFEADANAEVRFDLGNVKALQENTDALFKRYNSVWITDIVTRAEVRGKLGLDVDEARDNIFYSDVKRAVAAATRPQFAPQDNGDAGADSGDKARVKAVPRKTRDRAFELMLETDVIQAIGDSKGEFDAFFQDLGEAAEDMAAEGVNLETPEEESKRIAENIMEGALDALAAIMLNLGTGVKGGAIQAVAFTLAISERAAWSAGANVRFAKAVETRTVDYGAELKEQTRRAVVEAIKSVRAGMTTEEVAQHIKSYVEGREMYPGKFEEAYKTAQARGASDLAAQLEGEAVAREYRAKLIAETEARTLQNLGVLESLKAGGVSEVRVEDGDGCGWRNHEDTDKAHNTRRTVLEARKYSLAHPNCKRRFFPVEEEGL